MVVLFFVVFVLWCFFGKGGGRFCCCFLFYTHPCRTRVSNISGQAHNNNKRRKSTTYVHVSCFCFVYSCVFNFLDKSQKPCKQRQVTWAFLPEKSHKMATKGINCMVN